MIAFILFIFSIILFLFSMLFSFLFHCTNDTNIKIPVTLTPVFLIISLLSGYIFLTGNLNSLPDIAFDGQENLYKSYSVLEENFSNTNYYVHILNENKIIDQINDKSVVAGLKIIKSDNENTLVKLKTIEHINGHYEEKEKIAIMHSNNVQSYLKNIYRSNAEIKANGRWHIPKKIENHIVNKTEIDNDISNIKKLLETH